MNDMGFINEKQGRGVEVEAGKKGRKRHTNSLYLLKAGTRYVQSETWRVYVFHLISR
jgi:hypothetical protein